MFYAWSGVILALSTAIDIALKLARLGQFMAIIEAIRKEEN